MPCDPPDKKHQPRSKSLAEADTCRHRKIRSFVLRQGRFTPAQQRAFHTLWPLYGLEYNGKPRNFDAIFCRRAKHILEIGFGNGGALRIAAHNQPEHDFIGVEVHAPGVGRLLNALAEDDTNNVRIFHHDAVEVLKYEISDNTLDEIRIYFPDPWHKKRHHKRRLIQSQFAQILASKLTINGHLHLATDWLHYAEQMWNIFDNMPQFRNRAGIRGYVDHPTSRPHTHFEARGKGLGHHIWDLLYDRVA